MKIVFTISALLMGAMVSAQWVEGVVVDAESQERLQNVKVAPQYSADWVLTDKEGRFKIDAKGSKVLVFKILGLYIQRGSD